MIKCFRKGTAMKTPKKATAKVHRSRCPVFREGAPPSAGVIIVRAGITPIVSR